MTIIILILASLLIISACFNIHIVKRFREEVYVRAVRIDELEQKLCDISGRVMHKIKCWPDYYAEILSGIKTFEARFDDRNYQVGDALLIQEYDPEIEEYTGRDSLFKVVYKLKNEKWLQPDCCILGITEEI